MNNYSVKIEQVTMYELEVQADNIDHARARAFDILERMNPKYLAFHEVDQRYESVEVEKIEDDDDDMDDYFSSIDPKLSGEPWGLLDND